MCHIRSMLMRGIIDSGRSKIKTYSAKRPVTTVTTFDDIAGCGGVKKDITGIVSFLREPAKFTK